MTKETIFYNRLIRLVKESGKSVNQIERELGYPRNTLHRYKNGSEPSGTRLIELAGYFNVLPEFLIGKSELHSRSVIPFGHRELSEKQKVEMPKLCQKCMDIMTI